MPLANSSYRTVPILRDGPGILNLAWTLDEREFLDVGLPAVLAAELAAESAGGLPYLDRYLVQDPYGAAELGPTVANYFGRPDWACQVTCGAGVTSLLHAAAGLAAHYPVGVDGECYPDLPHWVMLSGGTLRPLDECLGDLAPARLFLVDRPSANRSQYDDLGAVRDLCTRAARQDAIVVVDESYANYYPVDYSAVPLTEQLSNLAVLRGLSKGYWLGSLRLGYCVSSAVVADQLRTVLPPMTASSLSIRLAKAVLALGDTTIQLRQRIAEAKPEMLQLLRQAGFPDPIRHDGYVPQVHFTDGGRRSRAARLCLQHGLQGKTQPFFSPSLGRQVERYRLSVPLRASRMEQLTQHLTTAESRQSPAPLA